MSELTNGEQFLVNALAETIAVGRQRALYSGQFNGNTKRTKLWDEFGYTTRKGLGKKLTRNNQEQKVSLRAQQVLMIDETKEYRNRLPGCGFLSCSMQG